MSGASNRVYPVPRKGRLRGLAGSYEINYDGFRIVAHRDADGVRLVTRNGYDFADRFPLIVEAIAALPARSCVIDGEAIAVDDNGLSVFNLIRYRRQDHAVTLCAFDLLELAGEDLRQTPIEVRKATEGPLRAAPIREWPSISTSRPMAILSTGTLVRWGREGIVSKRLGSPYRSGRGDVWVKIKNPAAPAKKREAEEEWRK